MAPGRMNAKVERVSISTSETETSGVLLTLGAICLTVGIASATGRIAILDEPLRWLTAGGAFVLIASGIWWWRLKVEFSQRGVVFLPQVFHGKFNFLWSDIREWYWHSHSFTDSDGGVQVERQLILVLTNGQEMAMPYPYCCKELANQLSCRIGAATR